MLRTPSRPARLLASSFALIPALAVAQERVPPVTVARAEMAAVVHEIPVTGTVVSPQVSRISPEVSGRVARVHVEVGDRVKAGDRLVTLDPELAEIALRRARAATREAAAALADARRRLTDAEQLSSERAIAATALRSLLAEVQVDEAALARFQAEEARQVALVKRHEVSAPFAGAVSRKFANAGEWIEPGTAIVELVSTDSLRIDFQVSQEYFPRVEAGAAIEVALDAAPDRTLVGRIAGAVPQSDPNARTFLMLVHLENPDVAMIPGMSARARLRLGGDRRGVVVPRDALLRHPDGRVTVWVLAEDGADSTVTERLVTPGRTFEGRVEILDGLDAGSRVVLRGNEGLQEGQRVRVRIGPADV